MTERYGIAEWFGEPFGSLPPPRRQRFAAAALGESVSLPCPFKAGMPPCSKKGGVCSIRRYRHERGRITEPAGSTVITCPSRFGQADLLPRWLADIVGFEQVFLAREVPFMRSPETEKAAGRIDLVLSGDSTAAQWFGLEIQAVYFSGQGMSADFEQLKHDGGHSPPEPTTTRRPDWRSSSAKRLMPQLQVKAPTLRRWGTKLAVAVDHPFFQSIGGASSAPSHDLNEGDIIWLVPRVSDNHQLEPQHWEVLSLEASSEKLLAATSVKREEFESALRAKLQRIR